MYSLLLRIHSSALLICLCFFVHCSVTSTSAVRLQHVAQPTDATATGGPWLDAAASVASGGKHLVGAPGRILPLPQFGKPQLGRQPIGVFAGGLRPPVELNVFETGPQ